MTNSPTEGYFVKIACGVHHSVAIKDDGSIVTWGNNQFNQNKDAPTEGYFIKIACGLYHSIGLKDDGTIVTWGNDVYDQRREIPLDKMLV
jgi:alpha-tubulin suppressor-like RCC1 family protein